MVTVVGSVVPHGEADALVTALELVLAAGAVLLAGGAGLLSPVALLLLLVLEHAETAARATPTNAMPAFRRALRSMDPPARALMRWGRVWTEVDFPVV